MRSLLAMALAAALLAGCAYVDIGGDSTIRRYFRENLKDPMSLNVVSWGEKEAVAVHNATYARTVTYRAKNSYGGYVLSTIRFYVNENYGSGIVMHTEEIE